MTWFSRLKRRFASPPVTDEELSQLRDRSEQDGAKARAREKEVHDVASRLHWQRHQNHFGPLIWQALRGEGGADV